MRQLPCNVLETHDMGLKRVQFPSGIKSLSYLKRIQMMICELTEKTIEQLTPAEVDALFEAIMEAKGPGVYTYTAPDPEYLLLQRFYELHPERVGEVDDDEEL